MPQLNRKARINIRANDAAVFNAQVMTLVRAVENLFARERHVGSSTYRQDGLLRFVVKDAASELRASLNRRGGGE